MPARGWRNRARGLRLEESQALILAKVQLCGIGPNFRETVLAWALKMRALIGAAFSKVLMSQLFDTKLG